MQTQTHTRSETQKPRTHFGLKLRANAKFQPQSECGVKYKPGNDLLSHDLEYRSIIGDGGLNCRVRNGTGCTSSSMVARKFAGCGGAGRYIPVCQLIRCTQNFYYQPKSTIELYSASFCLRRVKRGWGTSRLAASVGPKPNHLAVKKLPGLIKRQE